jgi:hypothetical protein
MEYHPESDGQTEHAESAIILPFRPPRPTQELLEMRNRWETKWAVYLAMRSTSGKVHEGHRMSMWQFQLWMQRVSDEELSAAYRKWIRTPREHEREEFLRAAEGWEETA